MYWGIKTRICGRLLHELNASHCLKECSDSSDSFDSESDSDDSDSLLPSGRTKAPSNLKILDNLETALEAEGFEKFETVLAGDGVGVLWPAVLHNGNEEEGGEEIDQEKFLRAEGNEGIERLVGVAGTRRPVAKEVREGWKFWRP